MRTADQTVHLLACVTHLSTGDWAGKQQQVNQAVDFVLDHSSGMAAFLGGDFNIEQDEEELDEVYSSSGGNFTEMDHCTNHPPRQFHAGECNRKTHIKDDPNAPPPLERKIDYLFFRQAFALDTQPVAPINVDTSDHHVYLGTIDICDANDC